MIWQQNLSLPIMNKKLFLIAFSIKHCYDKCPIFLKCFTVFSLWNSWLDIYYNISVRNGEGGSDEYEYIRNGTGVAAIVLVRTMGEGQIVVILLRMY